MQRRPWNACDLICLLIRHPLEDSTPVRIRVGLTHCNLECQAVENTARVRFTKGVLDPYDFFRFPHARESSLRMEGSVGFPNAILNRQQDWACGIVDPWPSRDYLGPSEPLVGG